MKKKTRTVKVTAVGDPAPAPVRRLGFMAARSPFQKISM
jgi:hypothetical protein